MLAIYLSGKCTYLRLSKQALIEKYRYICFCIKNNSEFIKKKQYMVLCEQQTLHLFPKNLRLSEFKVLY